MALVIAGERSGAGKTTVTLALLSFLSRQGHQVQSFKVGPDYIDPMFHSYITGRPCRNLDPVLTSEAYVQSCFARHCQEVDLALVEGVMGLFDGVRKDGETKKSHLSNAPCPMPRAQCPNNFASTAHIARLLNLPILLVIDCSRLSGSVAAILHGYRSFDPTIMVAGVVLNRVGSDRHLELLQDALEPMQVPILGVLRRQDQITIPDRHLGLVPTAELDGLDERFDQLAQLGTSFNWQSLSPLLQVKPQQVSPPPSVLRPPSVKIAVARDRAFNFYYADNFDLLQELGAELVFWSPMAEKLPKDVQGLYFGGGFPEVFAQQLAQNQLALNAVYSAIKAGMPTYAECGGLMYLCEQLVDLSGSTWQMVGVLPTEAVMSKRLTLGYRQATAVKDSVFLRAGEAVWGHEFHRSQLTLAPSQPIFKTTDIKQKLLAGEGWKLNNLHASYIHLHFGEYKRYLQRFLHQCVNFTTR